MWTIFWIVICFKNINIFWTGEQILKKQEHFLNSEHFLNLENKILKLRTKFKHKYFLKVRTFFESWEQILKRRTNLDNFLKHEHFLNLENKFWNREQIWKHEQCIKARTFFEYLEQIFEQRTNLKIPNKFGSANIFWTIFEKCIQFLNLWKKLKTRIVFKFWTFL